jgi:4-hydroxy-3-methylbut-2-enyl diphosphate reductase
VIIFVSDIDSSNGKELFESAKSENPNSYFVSSADEIEQEWFQGIENIGICGATSTPFWFLEEIKSKIIEKI